LRLVLTIRAFRERQNHLKVAVNANSNLSYDNYWRLIALASSDFFFTIPLTLKTIVLNSLSGVSPWVSWDDTHSGFSRVFQFPRVRVNQDPILLYSCELTRWGVILCAYLIFGFFGFTNEAKRNYRLLASKIAKPLGFTIPIEKVPKPGPCIIDHSLHFALPVSITQQTVSATGSDSFSDKSSTGVDKFNLDLEAQPGSPTKRLTSTSSTSFSIDEVPRLPEPVFDPAAVGKPFVPVAPTSTHPRNAPDRE
jgi:pheromone a factor receptor